MASLENLAEQVEILILKGSQVLSQFAVVRQDEDQNADIDRIVVSASPREPELFGPDGARAIVIKIAVSCSIILVTRDVYEMDLLVQAVDEANDNITPAALALAGLSFPNGAFIRQTETGSRDNGQNHRMQARTFDFIVNL